MKINIKLTLYFEIKNSQVYGGMGSIGYSEIGVEFSQINYEKDNLFNKKEIMERYISVQTKNTAELLGVPAECVRLISKEEYEENTDDD